MAVLVLVVEVTLPVEPLLPVPLASPLESSRLKENLFGLRLKLATLFVTYSCRELKKLIFVVDAEFSLVVSADTDFSSERACHPRLLLEFFLGSLLGTEMPRCASKFTGIDLTKGRLDTVCRLTHREGRSLGNFYGTSSQYRFSATTICNFTSDPFRDSPKRFLLAAGVIVLRQVFKILHSSDVSARVDSSRQSSVKNWKDKIRRALCS